MAVEVPQNEEIFGGGKNKPAEGVGSAICRRRANRGNINIKEREQRGIVGSYIIRAEKFSRAERR